MARRFRNRVSRGIDEQGSQKVRSSVIQLLQVRDVGSILGTYLLFYRHIHRESGLQKMVEKQTLPNKFVQLWLAGVSVQVPTFLHIFQWTSPT